MMNNERICAGISWLSTMFLSCIQQANEWLSFIFLLVSLLCSLYNTLLPLIRKAKADGKITGEEIDEIVDKVKDEVDKAKDTLDKKDK